MSLGTQSERLAEAKVLFEGSMADLWVVRDEQPIHLTSTPQHTGAVGTQGVKDLVTQIIKQFFNVDIQKTT